MLNANNKTFKILCKKIYLNYRFLSIKFSLEQRRVVTTKLFFLKKISILFKLVKTYKLNYLVSIVSFMVNLLVY